MKSQRYLQGILARLPMKQIYNLLISKEFCHALKGLQFHHIYRQITHWSKEKQLNAFLDFYYYLDPQGSSGWRKFGIGGSEMSVITEENDNKDFRGLIGEKSALPEYSFSGSIATRWGNLFEPVLGQYVSCYLNTEIHETGSIPGIIRRNNGDPIQRYSPDGLALVKKRDYARIVNETSQYYFNVDASNDKEFKTLPDDLILLFEFKNPFMRMPKGVVKKDYLAQPKSGMCTIPIVDATLFVDGVIRKCSISDFNLGPSYDWKFNPKSKKLPYDKCIACGFIGIMDTDSHYEAPSHKENIWDISDDEDPHGAVVSSRSSNSQAYDTPVALPENEKADIISAMVKLLARAIIQETQFVKSDHHKLPFVLENLATIVRLAMNMFNITANDSFADVVFTYDDQVKIIKGVVTRLFNYQWLKTNGAKETNNVNAKKLGRDVNIKKPIVKDDTANDIKTACRMIPNIIDQLSYEEPTYDLNTLYFGLDYGSSSLLHGVSPEDFEAFAEKAVNERFTTGGIKLYYPESFFFDYDREDAERFLKRNYIDCSLDRDTSAKKWLFTNVEEFIAYCQEKNVRPMGILPWKLYEACAMPMYREPGFIWKHEEKIRETITIIDEIMQTENIDERRTILDRYYSPPKPKRAPVPRGPRKKADCSDLFVETTSFDSDTVSFFENMDVAD